MKYFVEALYSTAKWKDQIYACKELLDNLTSHEFGMEKETYYPI